MVKTVVKIFPKRVEKVISLVFPPYVSSLFSHVQGFCPNFAPLRGIIPPM